MTSAQFITLLVLVGIFFGYGAERTLPPIVGWLLTFTVCASIGSIVFMSFNLSYYKLPVAEGLIYEYAEIMLYITFLLAFALPATLVYWLMLFKHKLAWA